MKCCEIIECNRQRTPRQGWALPRAPAHRGQWAWPARNPHGRQVAKHEAAPALVSCHRCTLSWHPSPEHVYRKFNEQQNLKKNRTCGPNQKDASNQRANSISFSWRRKTGKNSQSTLGFYACDTQCQAGWWNHSFEITTKIKHQISWLLYFPSKYLSGPPLGITTSRILGSGCIRGNEIQSTQNTVWQSCKMSRKHLSKLSCQSPTLRTCDGQSAFSEGFGFFVFGPMAKLPLEDFRFILGATVAAQSDKRRFWAFTNNAFFCQRLIVNTLQPKSNKPICNKLLSRTAPLSTDMSAAGFPCFASDSPTPPL